MYYSNHYLFGIHGLASRDSHHIVDIVDRATTRKVVHRTCNTLQNRADGDGIAKALHELIAYVTHFKVREYEHVCIACNVATGSFLGTNGGNEGCIGLQLTVDLQLGSHLTSQLSGFNHLVDHLVLGTALRREAQHGNAGILKACHRLGCLCRADCNLSQLVGIGHRRNGHIANNNDTGAAL